MLGKTRMEDEKSEKTSDPIGFWAVISGGFPKRILEGLISAWIQDLEWMKKRLLRRETAMVGNTVTRKAAREDSSREFRRCAIQSSNVPSMALSTRAPLRVSWP